MTFDLVEDYHNGLAKRLYKLRLSADPSEIYWLEDEDIHDVGGGPLLWTLAVATPYELEKVDEKMIVPKEFLHGDTE